MLDTKELDKAAATISEFRAASEQQHKNLTQIIHEYACLLEDYRRLKSDLEEERESRERYKQIARGQERNPFVLVLIDGDGYVFRGDLVSNGTRGGERAGSLLNDVVKSNLRRQGLEYCHVMVRMYANLTGLSRALSRNKLIGAEKNSLAPFTASFTSSNDLFDFVDAGELKDNVYTKIRAAFRHFVDNAQCRHIYFAACHDGKYFSDLTSYAESRHRITLVRAPSFQPEFSRLGLRVEDFQGLFDSAQLDGHPAIFTGGTSANVPEGTSSSMSSRVESTAPLCSFFQKGICKYGESCRYIHIKKDSCGKDSSLTDSCNWCKSGSGTKKTYPLSQLNKSDHGFMLHGANYNSGTDLIDPHHLHVDFSTRLPKEEDIPVHHIAINKQLHRLDAYISSPTSEDKVMFNARIKVQKLCNNHHLFGNCKFRSQCEYDHSPISPELLNFLRHMLRNKPCPRKGTCRSVMCHNGHICQKVDCTRRGGKVFCKFGEEAHNQPLETIDFVAGLGMRDEHVDEWDENSSPPAVHIAADVDALAETDKRDLQGLNDQGALLDFSEEEDISTDWKSAGVADCEAWRENPKMMD